jgi:TorA maturation chaperone TorD
LDGERVEDSGIAEEDLLRANIYSLLGRLLARPPDRATLDAVAGIKGDETELGQALQAMAAAARASTPETVDDEYHALFIGLGDSELNPYGSYYLTGFLYEKPLAKLRGDMAEIGIARADQVYEPEDHIAALCEMMCGLITGAFGQVTDLDEQQNFFATHIAPWAERFFEDLERSPTAAFYMPIGTVGKLFVAIENQAFQMAA